MSEGNNAQFQKQFPIKYVHITIFLSFKQMILQKGHKVDNLRYFNAISSRKSLSIVNVYQVHAIDLKI